MQDDAKPLPTPGHFLTSMEMLRQVTETKRNRIPAGSMVRYPWPSLPIGWARCTGGKVDAGKYPDLAAVTGGTLPSDAEWIIKL